MTSRGKWVRVAVVVILTALVAGRFLAVTTADRLWVSALGVEATHAAIARVRLMLLGGAFVAAVAWCVGNLYLVYRSIGSVSVPRRLGNIEIFEALPRRYLLYAAVGVGLVLALAVSHRAGEWWYASALARHHSPVGVSDPVLGRDVSYYLFVLPWWRTIHSYVTLLSGLMLGVVAVLYAAVGAVRWHERRLLVSGLARKHLGGVLAVFALALLWGYRLEPAEYVAGIHNVPLDDVLISVRLPSARLLSALALTAGATSLLWMWIPRLGLALVPWSVLAVVSFFGHYIVPSFSGSVRPPQELLLPEVEAARPRLLGLGFGAAPLEASVAARSDAQAATLERRMAQLAVAPLWDAFATRVLFDRTAPGSPYTRFADVQLSLYRDSRGGAVPIYLGVRQVDLQSVRNVGSDLSWERVHGPPYSHASGAVAVLANRVSQGGEPFFVADLTRPDTTVSEPIPVNLRHPDVLFGPALNDFAVLSGPKAGIVGIRAGGPLRRLALAWALQSPKLLTSDLVADTSLVLWRRSVAERLEHFAPFAQFDEPYAVVHDERLYWLSSGYVSARGFAVTPRLDWRGQDVRYVRSSMIGLVDAFSGRTSVYLLRDPDPVSAAWAELAPEILRPAEELPQGLRQHLRYPREAFAIQLRVMRQTQLRDATSPEQVSPIGHPALQDGAPIEFFWWVGGAPRDSVVRLRIVAAIEAGDPPALVALADGTVVDGTPVLTLTRLQPPHDVEGPSLLARRLALLRPSGLDGVDGIVRTAVVGDGVLKFQSLYSATADAFDSPPRLAEVGVGWGNVVGRGATLRDAVTALATRSGMADATFSRWGEARRWFRRLDSARQSGDWNAFGRAYEELKRLLGEGREPAP